MADWITLKKDGYIVGYISREHAEEILSGTYPTEDILKKPETIPDATGDSNE